jgi:hypothetical protein
MMRRIPIWLLLLILVSCRTDEEVYPKRKFISMKFGEEVLLSEQRVRAIYTIGNPTNNNQFDTGAYLEITDYENDHNIIINIVLRSMEPRLQVGEYPSLDGSATLVIAFEDLGELYEANSQNGTLHVEVLRLENDWIEARFSGHVVSSSTGTSKPIQDGYFRLTLPIPE